MNDDNRFGPANPQPYYPPQPPQAVPNGLPQQINDQGYATSYRNVQSAPIPPEPRPYGKKSPDRQSVASKFIELTYFILIIIESVLALRFLFKLLGANPLNTFIQFLYQITEVFTLPFVGLFGVDMQNSINVSGYQLEFTTLVAMGVYALIAYIVIRLIDLFR